MRPVCTSTVDAAGAEISGFVLTAAAGTSSINDLGIVRFSADGISVDGASGLNFSDLYVGTDGSEDLGNGGAGIAIESGGNVIVWQSVVSGNDGSGIDIRGSLSSDNQVSASRIGTNASGTVAIPNGGDGITVRSEANIIGGTEFGNVISGNGGAGVRYSGPQLADNTLSYNVIGTDADGTAALGNNADGVRIEGTDGDPMTVDLQHHCPQRRPRHRADGIRRPQRRVDPRQQHLRE